MTNATATRAIEREVFINAAPEIVWRYFTDPDRMVKWMAREASLDPRPGGGFLLDYNGFDRARGTFVAVEPHTRIVFTWGWESLADQTPPGASTVEVTLTRDGAGTLLHLVHSGLAAHEAESHGQGWDLFLPFLVDAAAGGVGQPAATPLTGPERFASILNARLCSLRYALESMAPAKWDARCNDTGWSVRATAAHAVSHLALVDFAARTAAGERGPQADFTPEALSEYGQQSAIANANVTVEQVLQTLLSEGPAAVERLKAIDAETLGNAQPMAFANGEFVSAAAIIESALLSDIADHLADIAAAS